MHYLDEPNVIRRVLIRADKAGKRIRDTAMEAEVALI